MGHACCDYRCVQDIRRPGTPNEDKDTSIMIFGNMFRTLPGAGNVTFKQLPTFMSAQPCRPDRLVGVWGVPEHFWLTTYTYLGIPYGVPSESGREMRQSWGREEGIGRDHAPACTWCLNDIDDGVVDDPIVSGSSPSLCGRCRGVDGIHDAMCSIYRGRKTLWCTYRPP